MHSLKASSCIVARASAARWITGAPTVGVALLLALAGCAAESGSGNGATGAPDLTEVTEGSSFVFVSGLAGQSKRDYAADLHDDDTWWANIYAGGHHRRDGQTSTFFSDDFGALFIDFNINGDPRRARGFFKTIAGDVTDEFTIVTSKRLSSQ